MHSLIAGWHEIAWDEVERVRSCYQPWQEDRLVLDSSETAEENIKAAIGTLQVKSLLVEPLQPLLVESHESN